MSRNMTQEEFARRLSVSRSTVAMWETGANMPESNRLVSIAKVLECSIDELFGENEKSPQ